MSIDLLLLLPLSQYFTCSYPIIGLTERHSTPLWTIWMEPFLSFQVWFFQAIVPYWELYQQEN
jgi:hypothetical protein